MHDQQNQEVLDLHSYLHPIRRRKWIIVAIVVVATAATYIIASRQQKTYAASASLYVQSADPTQNITDTGAQTPPTPFSIADVAQLITAQSVTSSVAQALGIAPGLAAASVSATPVTDSDFVTVTATSNHPTLAAKLANTYVSAFLASRRQAVRAEALGDARAAQASLQTIPNTPANLAQRQTVLQQIDSYRQIALNPSAGARAIDTAAVPSAPSSPRPKRDAIFGAVVGLVLAVIIAFCLELLDRRLVRISTVESMYDRPVLAVLPHVSDPTPLVEGARPAVPPQFVEELRSLRVMMRLGDKSNPRRTIIVTSALPKEGKSTVVRDLALVYAEAGERVLVIDGDLRRPCMEALFGFQADSGLVEVLEGRADLADSVHHVAVPERTRQPSTNGHSPASSNGHARNGSASRAALLDVLAHGQLMDNPVALLSSEAMANLLAHAAHLYDVVLVDTPPVLTVADSVPLLELVDSVLVVTRLGQTTSHSADRFTDLIDRLSDVNFTGVIANDRREQFDDEGYGSYGRYGYGYYHGKRPAPDRNTVGSPVS